MIDPFKIYRTFERRILFGYDFLSGSRRKSVLLSKCSYKQEVFTGQSFVTHSRSAGGLNGIIDRSFPKALQGGLRRVIAFFRLVDAGAPFFDEGVAPDTKL